MENLHYRKRLHRGDGEQEDVYKKRTQREQDMEQDEHKQDTSESEGAEQSYDGIGELFSFIRRETSTLKCLMTMQSDLLDVLLSSNVLTTMQVSLIEEENSLSEQARLLLKEITRESISDEKKAAFLNALDQTQQKHVANWIRGCGQRAAKYGDDWPLLHCAEFITLTANRVQLFDLIDLRNGLLDEMFAAQCINDQQKNAVEEGATAYKQNKTLFNILSRWSLANYQTFMSCLLQTKQQQVVHLLAPLLAGDIRPLSNDQQSRLRMNYSTLINTMNSKDGLIDEMFAADCITWRQKEFIEQTTITHSENNRRVLEIIRKGSATDFHKFIGCLNKTGQHHVSRILTEDGTVAFVVATISPANDRQQRERQIVDQLTNLLRHIPDERIEELVDMARQHINQLRQNEVEILTADIGHSIGLYYFTTSLRGLQYLRGIYSNGQLESMMQEMFIVLLKTDDADETAPNLCVDTFRWDLSNYSDCLQQLYTLMNLPILSHVYEMAKHNPKLVSICDDVRSLPIDQLPFELVEMILVKAAGYLFVTINRRTPRAEVYTLATMTAVRLIWWQALSYRKFIKRSLRRYFIRICHPFRCSPQQVASLHIEGNKNVWGVAVLHNELYVACEESNIIQVFDSRPPFSRRNDIKVQELKDAIDITVCGMSSQLYIADWAQRAIWRVKLLSSEPADNFITIQWKPRSLSVNSSRLLITPLDGKSLYLYDDDGHELHHIELPRYMMATHAVETTRNTYVVGHTDRFFEDRSSHSDSVTEIDVNGRVINSFNNFSNSIPIKWPRYLVYNNDHVIVADLVNGRIILLKPDLQVKQILINELQGKRPERICLTPSRLLIASYYDSTCIDIFKV